MRGVSWLGLTIAMHAMLQGHTAQLEDLSAFPRGTVTIAGTTAEHRFGVWIADTPARKAQGLMFVRDLPAGRGMLFLHEPPRPVSMWMKNTYIELDMLFVADGRVAAIIERAPPHSVEHLQSRVPVSAVIEIRGGEVARLGLKKGDRVHVQRFRQSRFVPRPDPRSEATTE